MKKIKKITMNLDECFDKFKPFSFFETYVMLMNAPPHEIMSVCDISLLDCLLIEQENKRYVACQEIFDKMSAVLNNNKTISQFQISGEQGIAYLANKLEHGSRYEIDASLTLLGELACRNSKSALILLLQHIKCEFQDYNHHRIDYFLMKKGFCLYRKREEKDGHSLIWAPKSELVDRTVDYITKNEE